MANLRSTDDMMKEYLISTRQDSLDAQRDARIEAADPGYLDQESTRERNAYAEEDRQFNDVILADKGRDLGEHLQDMGSGVLGSLVGGVGGAGDLALQAIADSIANVGGAMVGMDATWDRTAGALGRIGQNQETFRSMQSEKSDAFDRVSAYRQQRAVEQANLESQTNTGEDASWLEKGAAEFGSAAGSYIDDPGQILTEGVAQLPYLIGGAAAKFVTTGTKLANPLIGQLIARGMAKESAEKLVQMGIVGGVTGSMEGADAASSAYARVMASTDTFRPGQEAERESAALEAAGKAFLIAGSTAAVTGTLASKFDLSPFSAVGGSALARSGDNLVKALQEGVQEAIESGTSQFAGNYAGNTVLKGEDLVELDQGVGGAAGTGLVVGAGSTVVTNPRSALDAAVAPLALAGKGFSYVAGQAQAKERRADLATATTTANDIVANSTTPAMAAALQQGVQQPAETTNTPAEQVELPPEINTSSQVSLFATGMQYLRGKDMNSEDAVKAFHVLGAVLASANNIRSLREGAKQDAADTSLTPEGRAAASQALSQLDGLIDNEKLDKWVAEMPMEDIEADLENLTQNPEAFGTVIAHLAAMNPLKMTDRLNSEALKSKNLTPDQRNSILLAQELKQAEAELKVSGVPDSEGVTRSMMQTGFPGATENDSVAAQIGRVTSALEQNDTVSAQTYFNKLAKFSKYELTRAAAYEAAAERLSKDPDGKPVLVEGYGSWDPKTGKFDKNRTPNVNNKENSLKLVKAIRQDADTVAKMVALLSKRTGLKAAEAVAEAPQTPQETVKAQPAAETAKAAPVKAEASVVDTSDKSDPANLSDTELDQSIAKSRGLRREILNKERIRRDAEAIPGGSDRAILTKPSVAARVGIVIEDDATPAPATEPAAPAPAAVVSSSVSEPSKNHLKNLQPSYEVAEGASVAEQNDAKNHLSQSFTTSKGEALIDKLPGSAAEIGATGDNVAVVDKVFRYKNSLVARLQEQLAKKFPKSKRIAMLKGQNFWKEPNAHSLYATAWDEAGIAYDAAIADVMAWTSVQHLLDMVHPVKWSAEKEAAFLSTYGDDILPLLQQGWVPLADQAYQVGQKLQTNLGLTPDTDVSLEYTEGTMLALAMDSLGVMMAESDYNGALEVKQVATLEGPLVNWVRVTTNQDLLHDSARAMEGFFPERASTAAGIVGTKPTKVNSFYRGSRQKVGKKQTKALLKMSQTSHKLSPLLSKLWEAMPDDAMMRLFGHKPVPSKPISLAEIAQDGANRTLEGDMKTIAAHIRAVIAHAEETGTEITDVESFFEYEMVVNGRAMTKGTSPQSSKLYRELFSTVQAEVDPLQENRGFMMAVAQGLGIKMDKQPNQASLDQLARWLKQPSVIAGLAAAARLAGGDISQAEADVTTLLEMKDDEGKAIEMSAHALSAMAHMAKYQKGKPFISSLSYEIDGLTDGPINLMMLLGLQSSATQMEHWLGLGGLWFGENKIAVQDKLEELKERFNGSKDLYEIIAAKASELNAEQAQRLLKSVPADQQQQTKRMIQAILHLMDITKLSKSDLKELTAKHSRSFTKKPTQAAGYMQGAPSIVNDLTKSLIEALSKRIDAKDQMTPADWAAVDMLFSHKLVYSKNKKQHFLIKNPDELKGLVWEGQELNRKQFKALASSLMQFGGSGLADATMEIIGYQRARMFDAVSLVNAHIRYAQETLDKAYKAKQNEEVAAGRLHPEQALSKKDEQALIKQAWDSFIPHPMLRNTGGLPSSSTTRTGVPKQNVRRVQGVFQDRQNLQVSEASFEDPGVAFAALSIMASGDGSMMTGFFSNMQGNFLNMFDGVYLDPAQIDAVMDAINKEVKQNWEHDYIGSVLDSLKMNDEGFKAWAQAQEKDQTTLWDELQESVANLEAQRKQQTSVMADINSRDHSVSHMAGGGNPYWQKGTAFNSTTLGTSVTDPLLDLAADELGNVANGIRKMSVVDVKALMKGHTFENPVLSGLWRVLSPLLNEDMVLYMSSDKQAMADFYQQNERREMGQGVDGVSVGNAVYVRAVNAETMVHELLHATTKNLTATYFASPSSLTKQQQEAMKNLLSLKAQFMEMDASTLPPHQGAMVEHVQAIMRGLDENSSLQEFLAYGLTNYHLQRTLGKTKSTLGKLLESVFNAVKVLFGFPNGTQSDSMLAQMFSNFEALTAQAVDQVYPVSVDEALNAINPDLARKFEKVLKILEEKATSDASKIQAQAARTDGLIRMQEIGATNLFPSLTPIQVAAGSYVQAMFAVGIQIKSEDNALLASVVDEVRDAGPKLWRSNDNPNDQADIALAEARYSFFFDPIIKPGAKLSKERHEYLSTKHDLAADILAMTLVNLDFAQRMNKEILGRKKIDKSKLNNWLDSVAEKIYELMNTGLTLKKNASLADALELAAVRMQKSMLASAAQRQQQMNSYRRLTNKLNEGVQYIGEKAGKLADERLNLKGNKDWIGSGLTVVAALGNDSYADNLGRLTLSLTNQIEGMNPARELVQEMVGTVTNNFKLIQLKGVATRMVSAVRQSFREQVPATVKSWFKDLTPEQDELLHLVIGKMALYDVSQDIRDQMEQVLTDPTNAIKDAEAALLAGGNRTKRLLMVKYAKQLGDHMANQGKTALYRNTEAVRTLAIHGGGEKLSETEMEALENLSTLQALTHLSSKQRRETVSLLRENPEGFWKTTVLIHSFKNFDTQRAGNTTATLNFQKGWIPVESDGRKKLRLVKTSEVASAERLGWVQVGKFADDPSMVYMATTVGKTPTLSGGAIHSVDMHMNGIHYHSGMPIDPGIQTTITNPKVVAEIKSRILNGEVLPYTVLYDSANDVVGFQRLLDPKMVDLHTKTVGRISDAAGIWMGRLHEESIAHGQNDAAATLLRDTWDEGRANKEENEFVDIRSGRSQKGGPSDKVIINVWETLPYHTKLQLEKAFANGSKNPPIWIRKDQLNDAIGYHKASAGNFFTRDNRYADNTNDQVAALARQMVGKGAYKYVIMGEESWQALIGSAKDTIIVKSLFIALNNLASNQTQLMMITGNPIWNIRVQSQKHKELVSYLGYQQRLAKLHAEEFATNDPNGRARIDAEQKQLHVQIRRLSIWPLIEAGELPTIAEGLSETEEFSMMGDLTAWLEKQVGKMPPVVGTVLNNLAISKETSLYKGMDRMVQYGDFVAKATMYEWMTTQDQAAKKEAIKLLVNDKNPDKAKRINIAQALHIVALKEVNDEFVNYSRLPGRWRTYGEDMGMLWFFNYKLRIMKMTARRARKNPAAFLIGSQVGGLLGVQTLLDTLPWNMNLAYSTGIDPLFTAHQTILWNQLFD